MLTRYHITKTPDKPLPFDLDGGEEILWTLHKPQPPGSMQLRVLLWGVAVVLGMLAMVLLATNFALAFLPGVVAFLFFLVRYLRAARNEQPDYVLIKC